MVDKVRSHIVRMIHRLNRDPYDLVSATQMMNLLKG